MSGIVFEPLIPVSLWLVLAALALGVWIWYAWRRPAAMPKPQWIVVNALAAIGMLLLLAILLNPHWHEPIPPPAGKPLLTILVDRSASMKTEDQKESRLSQAARIAKQTSQRLETEFETRIKTFAAATANTSAGELETLVAEGQTTNLARAIGESLESERPQGQAILLLSDGIHNAPGGIAEVLKTTDAARALAAPIYTVALGDAVALKDLELTLSHQQELAFVGQPSTIHASVRQRGGVASNLEVILLFDGKEIDKKAISMSPDSTARVAFQVAQPQIGLYRYEVRCQSFPTEAAAENNTSAFVLRTVDRPVRVLLLEGKPYWDAKFLMSTLSLNASLEIDAMVRVAEGRTIHRRLRIAAPTLGSGPGEEPSKKQREEITEVVKGLPPAIASSEGLNDYQVIVLGRDAEEFLSDEVIERIRTWISKEGGSLVCYRGAPVANLKEQLTRLMPVRWSPTSEERFRISFTGRGRDLNWISADDAVGLARMPSLVSTAKPQRPTPLAVVLAQSEGAAQPALSYQPYGTGRVVALEGAGMWRWAFLAPEYQVDEPVYDFLWQGLIRWLVAGGGLAPGQNAALRVDRATFSTEEPATATYLVRTQADNTEPPVFELKNSEDKSLGQFKPAPLGDEPGVYRLLFGSLPPGQYKVSGGDAADPTLSIAFDVRASAAEQLDISARPDLLAKIAQESGGAALAPEKASEIGQIFSQQLAKSRPLQIRRIPLWDKVWVLLAVVGCWASAWGIRRAGGLI